MRGVIRILIALLFAAALAGSSFAGDTKSFFSGKDFDGWEGLIKQYWSIKNGALVGHSAKNIPHNTFLCSKKQYGDFELNFQVRVVDQNGKSGVMSRNSGIQIRSVILDPTKFTVKGPQCDIGGGYWGSLYGEHFGGMMKKADAAAVKNALKKSGFNDYSIRCVGKRVTIKINGETTVDGEFPKMPSTGIIAWQLHSGGPMTITFRKIKFKSVTQ